MAGKFDQLGHGEELPVFTVATAPAAASCLGQVIYVSDGDTGSPCIAVSNGTNWLRIALGTAIAAA